MVRVSSLATPKTFSSIQNYLEETQFELSSIVSLLLGSGINSDSVTNVASTFNISVYTNSYGEETVSLTSTYPDILHLSHKVLNPDKLFALYVKNKINGATSKTIPFDETFNIVNGSDGNPVEVPYFNSVGDFDAAYSKELIASTIYVNGTPQRAENINIVSRDATNRKAWISFSRITEGYIYPDPVDLSGNINLRIVKGAYLSDIFSDFGNPIELSFSNLVLHLTSRPLILEVYNIDTDTRKYFLVRSEIKADQPYYEITGANSLKIHIPTEVTDAFPPTSTFTRIYFAQLAELSAYAQDNRFYKQFSIGLTDLLPDDSDLKIFAISRSTGEIVELVAESNTLLGKLYDIDFATGKINVYNIGGRIPQDIYLAVAGFKYAPPMKVHNTGDYPNTITLWYSIGGTYAKAGGLPDTLYVYFIPKAEYRDVISYVTENGKVASVPQIEVFEDNFVITETPISGGVFVNEGDKFFNEIIVEPVKIGELSRSGSTYTFIPNPTAQSPYDRLRDLASQMPLVASSTAFETVKLNDSPTVPASVPFILPIEYMHPSTQEVVFFGLAGKVNIYSSIEKKQYRVELGYYDQGTGTFSVLLDLGTFDSNVDNAFVTITHPDFPDNSLWNAAPPTTDVYLALRFTVTNPASGESEYTYDYDFSVYINAQYN